MIAAAPGFIPCAPVSREERRAKHGHPGCVIWLTGLSAAGKTTIAIELERALFEKNFMVLRLDGDELRASLSANLGFSMADRSENVRRAACVTKFLSDTGFICVAALISPLRRDREQARQAMAPGRFVEVHVATPIEVCRVRDRKGLYRRADAGEIPEFTGVSSPYEPPLAPEVVVCPDQDSPRICAANIIAFLRQNLGW